MESRSATTRSLGLKLQVEAAVETVSKRLDEKFGAFEALFGLACLHFQESGCDFAVFEAGIGGRYDPVRLVGAHETCVTSVDYEHVELLGNSLELIVSDKSDACSCRRHHRLWRELPGPAAASRGIQSRRGCTPLFIRDDIRIDNEVTAASGQHFDFQFGYHDFRRLEVNLPGAFQLNNCSHCRRPVPALAAARTAAQGSGPSRDCDTRRLARCTLARPPRDRQSGPAHRNRRRSHPRRHPAITGKPAGDPRRR